MSMRVPFSEQTQWCTLHHSDFTCYTTVSLSLPLSTSGPSSPHKSYWAHNLDLGDCLFNHVLLKTFASFAAPLLVHLYWTQEVQSEHGASQPPSPSNTPTRGLLFFFFLTTGGWWWWLHGPASRASCHMVATATHHRHGSRVLKPPTCSNLPSSNQLATPEDEFGQVSYWQIRGMGWDILYQNFHRVCWKSPSTSNWWPSTMVTDTGSSSVGAAGLQPSHKFWEKLI